MALAGVGFVCLTASILPGVADALQSGAPLAPSRPNRVVANAEYVGRDACATCHAEIADLHTSSNMALAMRPPEESDILQANPKLTVRSGRFSYAIERRDNRWIYSVSDGTSTLTEPILYAFGVGKAGQTYVYRHADAYYESRVSYYRAIKGLDITIGHTPPPDSATLTEALGRKTPSDEIRACFSCHSTAGVSGKELRLERLVPGVNCESCHGPGSAHVAAVKAGAVDDTKIFNPGRLSGDTITQDFCGKCHRSAEQVLFMPNNAGINNVRFQPYRIFGSKCYSDDARISCIACHDPHGPLRQDDAFYDAKCLACHQAKGTPATAAATEPACPVAAKNCVSCHMPKVELPGAHLAFTDHRIRITKPGETFPN